MTPLFTLETSGHNPRPTKAERMRNRISHKFSFYPERYDGFFSCVGCGRCVVSCPVSLDIRHMVKAAVEGVVLDAGRSGGPAEAPAPEKAAAEAPAPEKAEEKAPAEDVKAPVEAAAPEAPAAVEAAAAEPAEVAAPEAAAPAEAPAEAAPAEAAPAEPAEAAAAAKAAPASRTQKSAGRTTSRSSSKSKAKKR